MPSHRGTWPNEWGAKGKEWKRGGRREEAKENEKNPLLLFIYSLHPPIEEFIRFEHFQPCPVAFRPLFWYFLFKLLLLPSPPPNMQIHYKIPPLAVSSRCG
jgi:hypothetical protein